MVRRRGGAACRRSDAKEEVEVVLRRGGLRERRALAARRPPRRPSSPAPSPTLLRTVIVDGRGRPRGWVAPYAAVPAAAAVPAPVVIVVGEEEVEVVPRRGGLRARRALAARCCINIICLTQLGDPSTANQRKP